MQERVSEEARLPMHLGKQRPCDRVATRDVLEVVRERRGVKVEMGVCVIAELEASTRPLSKQVDLGSVEYAVATEFSFVDEADRRYVMRLQRTNELTSEAVVVGG